jgi:hypothetical protein
MLELIEIVPNGLPINEPRSWLFIATFATACIAGWYCGDVLAWHKGRKTAGEKK